MTDEHPTQDTHTIQVWPSGDGYEYRGDPFEEPTQANGTPAGKRLRKHSFSPGKRRQWRLGRPLEWSAIQAEVRVERYIDREILKCDTGLVSDAIAGNWGDGGGAMFADTAGVGEWTHDNVSNLYPDPSEWDDAKCNEWLDDHGVEGAREDNDADTLRELVTEHAEPAEVYEWWAVTEWLAGELAAIGEPVLDNAYGYWWGRTCTGQAMKMDGTLQKIARRCA